MRRPGKSIWIALALAALPAPAAARQSPVCDAIIRMANSVAEPVTFASLGQALARGEGILPGFSSDQCQVTPDEVSCHATDFTARHFDQWPDPFFCEERPIGGDIPTARTAPDWHRTYVVMPSLTFEYGVSCMGCAGGTISYFLATPEFRTQTQDQRRERERRRLETLRRLRGGR